MPVTYVAAHTESTVPVPAVVTISCNQCFSVNRWLASGQRHDSGVRSALIFLWRRIIIIIIIIITIAFLCFIIIICYRYSFILFVCLSVCSHFYHFLFLRLSSCFLVSSLLCVCFFLSLSLFVPLFISASSFFVVVCSFVRLASPPFLLATFPPCSLFAPSHNFPSVSISISSHFRFLFFRSKVIAWLSLYLFPHLSDFRGQVTKFAWRSDRGGPAVVWVRHSGQ